MIISLWKERRVLPFIILIGVFIATVILKVNVIFIILFCGMIGAVSSYLSRYKKPVN
jgi:chromate transporter